LNYLGINEEPGLYVIECVGNDGLLLVELFRIGLFGVLMDLVEPC
jgi:hypothetical protein